MKKKRYAYDSQKELHPELFPDEERGYVPPDAGYPSAGCLPLLLIPIIAAIVACFLTSCTEFFLDVATAPAALVVAAREHSHNHVRGASFPVAEEPNQDLEDK